MKNIEIGDLVRIVNEWTGHNPWMKFPDEVVKIGLVVGLHQQTGHLEKAVVLVGNNEVVTHHRQLETLCK